jgi:nucleotide-binding universal stress UspA family protein
MKKKILVPTDFSRNAWDALVYAIELYSDVECEFYILNVFDFTGYAMENIVVPRPNNEYTEAVRNKSMAGLEKILSRLALRDEIAIHTFYTVSKQDNLLDAIKEVVELKDIDLVVMGTKGDGDMVNVAFGSNAVLVMEKERNCPVLAIPPGVIYAPPSEIVFPTSYRSHYKRRELTHLIEIAKLTGAPVRVLHARREDGLDERQKNYKSLLNDCLEEVTCSFHEVEEQDVGEAVKNFVEQRKSGMIAFINKKHTFFGSIFSRPLVKDLGLHSKVPVLALHDLRN